MHKNKQDYRAWNCLEYCMSDIITAEYGRHNDKIGAGAFLCRWRI